MGFSLFPYNSITVYMGVQFRTKLTGPHHLVIFDSIFFFFFFGADLVFPLAFYVTPSSATVFKRAVVF